MKENKQRGLFIVMSFKDLISHKRESPLIRTIALFLVLSYGFPTTVFSKELTENNTLRPRAASESFTTEDLSSLSSDQNALRNLLGKWRKSKKTGARLSEIEELKTKARHSDDPKDIMVFLDLLKRKGSSFQDIVHQLQNLNKIRLKNNHTLTLPQIRQILTTEEYPRALQDIGFTLEHQTALQEIVATLLGSLGEQDWSIREVSGKDLVNLQFILTSEQLSQIITVLLEGLRHEYSSVCQASAQTVGNLTRTSSPEQLSEIIEALLGDLKKKDSFVRRASIKAIGNLASISTPDQLSLILMVLLEELRDEYPIFRQASAQALGNLKVTLTSEQQSQIIPELLQRLTDRDRDTRQVSAQALGNLKVTLPTKQLSQVTTVLLRGLRNQDSNVRRASIKALRNFLSVSIPEQRSQIMKALIKSLGDKDWRRRYGSANALGNLEVTLTSEQRSQIIMDLLKGLRNEDFHLCEFAAEALGNFTSISVPEERSQIIVALLRYFVHRNSNVRVASIGALGNLRTTPGLEQLSQIIDHLLEFLRAPDIELLTSEDLAIRQASVKTLGNLASISNPEQWSQIITTLLRSLRDEDPNVRRLSAEALNHVLISHLALYALVKQGSVEFFEEHFEIIDTNTGSRLSSVRALEQQQPKQALNFFKSFGLDKETLETSSLSWENKEEAFLRFILEVSHSLKINPKIPVVHHLHLLDLLEGKDDLEKTSYLRFLNEITALFRNKGYDFFVFEDIENYQAFLKENNIFLKTDTSFPSDSRHRYLFNLNQTKTLLKQNQAFIPMDIQDNTNYLDFISTILVSGILSRKDLQKINSQDLNYLETILIPLSQNLKLKLTQEDLKSLNSFDKQKLSFYESISIKSRTLKNLNTYLKDYLRQIESTLVMA